MKSPPPPFPSSSEPLFPRGLTLAIIFSVFFVLVFASLPTINDEPPLQVALSDAASRFFFTSYAYLWVASIITDFFPHQSKRTRRYAWLLATFPLWSLPASWTFVMGIKGVLESYIQSGHPLYPPP